MGQPWLHDWPVFAAFRGRFDRQSVLGTVTLPRLTLCRSPSRGRSMKEV